MTAQLISHGSHPRSHAGDARNLRSVTHCRLSLQRRINLFSRVTGFVFVGQKSRHFGSILWGIRQGFRPSINPGGGLSGPPRLLGVQDGEGGRAEMGASNRRGIDPDADVRWRLLGCFVE